MDHEAGDVTKPTLSVIDPEQLPRIEAVHRGFLYQHLCAVGAILLAAESGVAEIIVEADEDLHLVSASGDLYVQVKTRNRPLIWSDIAGALERFDRIREQRGASRHSRFVIICNTHLGPELEAEYRSADWPGDVEIFVPGGERREGIGVPPSWPTVDAALEWCEEKASTVLHTRLPPAALTWKLAAIAQYAAAGNTPPGGRPHTFVAARFGDLLEVVARGLRSFPPVPQPYRPLINEPELRSEEATRLVVGPSGAGKTAWVSQVVAVGGLQAVYFDAFDVSEEALPSALAFEIAAHVFEHDRDTLATALRPGRAGFDALRALGGELRSRGEPITVVIDNAHRINGEAVARVIGVLPETKWIVVAQPHTSIDALSARLGIRAELLEGWSRDTVARVLVGSGCDTDIVTAERVRTITGGLPLFVTNLGALALSRYDGRAAALCDALERGVHTERTAQETLLEEVIRTLSKDAMAIAVVLYLAHLPLHVEDIAAAVSVRGLSHARTAAAVRELVKAGIARPGAGEGIELHEAFRLPVASLLEGIDPDEMRRIQRVVIDRMNPFTADRRQLSLEHLSGFIRLLGEAEDWEILVELASGQAEHMVEFGVATVLASALEKVVASKTAGGDAKFWALDSLTFWDIESGRLQSAVERLSDLKGMVEAGEVRGETPSIAVLIKSMLIAGIQGDVDASTDALAELKGISGDPQTLRIGRYNHAVVLNGAGRNAEVAEECWALAQEYFTLLGLEPEHVIMTNPPEIAARFGENLVDAIGDLKRLADSLSLYARAKSALGEPSGLARIHASKFYVVAQAYRSAVAVGQDVVDELLAMGDLEGARHFLEQTLMPSVEHLRLLEHVVPVRGQHAVVLAYSGEVDRAREVLDELLEFSRSSADSVRRELSNQRQLVEQIAIGKVSLGFRRPPMGGAVTTGSGIPVVARNSLCPCGSGRKYKKCHGKHGG